MIELMVLISETASAPPCCAARAGWRMSAMLGVSLTITGMRVCALHQRATISMYSGTWPTAEPMPRSDMPCGQPKFSSTPSHSVSSTRPRIARQDVFFARHHQRDHEGAIGPGALDLLDLAQVDLEIAVGDQLDVVDRDQPAVGPVDRAVARAGDVDDRRARLAERLPHHAAPAGAEGALDIDLAVGRRRRSEPERVGRLDADEIGAEIDHVVLLQLLALQRGVDRARRLFAVLDRADRQVEPAGNAIAARPYGRAGWCAARRRRRCGRRGRIRRPRPRPSPPRPSGRWR